MKRIISSVVIAVFLISSLGGCATTSQTGNSTATGAGLGGVFGAIAGGLLTGNIKGALAGAAIGAAAGALTGYIIGKYEENRVQTRQQVYQDYPEYSQRSTAPEPAIKDLKPELMDADNNPIESFTAGQTIKMTSEYTIVASPEVKMVAVVEDNYLVMPDGTKMKDAIRTKQRPVERVSAKQTVTLPSKLLPGKYTHVAIVKIGDKTEQSEQIIEVAAMKIDTKQYAYK